MFVRRVLLFLVLLLAVTALTAGLAPPPTERAPAPAPSPTPRADRSVVVERTLNAALARPRTVTVRTGDVLRLTVRADAADAVELQGLATLRAVAPDTPVTFDVLPDTPGEYPVVLTGAGRTVGTVRVVSRPR